MTEESEMFRTLCLRFFTALRYVLNDNLFEMLRFALNDIKFHPVIDFVESSISEGAQRLKNLSLSFRRNGVTEESEMFQTLC